MSESGGVDTVRFQAYGRDVGQLKKEILVKISARNQFKGTVTNVEKGAVNSVVQIEIAPGLVVTSSVTNESVEELGIKVGGEAFALIKASNVLVGVDA